MLKKHPVLKWSLFAFTSLIVVVVSFGFWFMSLLPPDDHKAELSQTLPQHLSYLSLAIPATVPAPRGRILAVVTSCGTMGGSQRLLGTN